MTGSFVYTARHYLCFADDRALYLQLGQRGKPWGVYKKSHIGLVAENAGQRGDYFKQKGPQ